MKIIICSPCNSSCFLVMVNLVIERFAADLGNTSRGGVVVLWYRTTVVPSSETDRGGPVLPTTKEKLRGNSSRISETVGNWLSIYISLWSRFDLWAHFGHLFVCLWVKFVDLPWQRNWFSTNQFHPVNHFLHPITARSLRLGNVRRSTTQTCHYYWTRPYWVRDTTPWYRQVT